MAKCQKIVYEPKQKRFAKISINIFIGLAIEGGGPSCISELGKFKITVWEILAF